MPTAILTYDSTVTSNWSENIANLQNDDSSWASSDTAGHLATITLSDLPADATAVQDITVKLVDAYIELRGASAVVKVFIQSGGVNLYNDSTTVNENIATYSQTTRTTSDGSSAWTVSEVNGLRIVLQSVSANPNYGGSGGLRIDQLQLVVNYTAAVVVPTPTYDSTVNNIHVTSGNINVTSGNIFI